jgi:hypothetical protein
MLDMGPYYITALVNMLGPVQSVMATASKALDERIATSEGARGQRIPVRTPTHLAGVMEFINGCMITIIMSFDIKKCDLTRMEIHGTSASMQCPDPNTFGGPVKLARGHAEEWTALPLCFPENARMIGVVDMASAIRAQRPHRASGALALHVLEVMTSFERSNAEGKRIDIKTPVERPAPLPLGLQPWEVED